MQNTNKDDETNLEHKEKVFTTDMTKMGSVKAHYWNGLEMLREKINKELDKENVE